MIEFYGKEVLPRIKHDHFLQPGVILFDNGNRCCRIVASRCGRWIARRKHVLGG